MTAPSLRLPLLAASFMTLVVAGCGARTLLRDTVDGGVATPDVSPFGDAPSPPVDAPEPIDVPAPPPIDVPAPPPIDVPAPPPIDVPVPPPVDVPLPPPVDVPIVTSSCERAIPVFDGTVLAAEDTAGLGGTAPICLGSSLSGGAPRWYRATVEPRQTLTVTAINEGGIRPPVVRLYFACTDTFCALGSGAAPDGRAVSLSFTNPSFTTQTVFIAVSGVAVGVPARYTLRTSIARAPDNVACASATRVVDGTVLRGEDLTNARTPSRWCSTSRNANALFYAVRVGPGEALTARAGDPGGGFPPPTLRLGDSCETTSCLASSIPVGPVGTVLSYLNTTGLPQELLLSADAGLLGAPPLRYDLSISVAPPPYLVSRTSIDCDPMAAAAVIPGAVGDDVGTEAIPLTIRFPYFGAPMAAWSVSTNGYLQVWPTPTGRSTGALGVAALPRTDAPSNMIAPFWDDLEVRPAEGMDVRWQTFDAPARHLTVQWNLGFCCGGGTPDRVTFQAKLFERSGVVEFHYCDQRGGERTRGQLASIGLQDESGSRGVSAQLRMPSIDPMTAFRLTPRP